MSVSAEAFSISVSDCFSPENFKRAGVNPRFVITRIRRACFLRNVRTVGDCVDIGREGFERAGKAGDKTLDVMHDILLKLYDIDF